MLCCREDAAYHVIHNACIISRGLIPQACDDTCLNVQSSLLEALRDCAMVCFTIQGSVGSYSGGLRARKKIVTGHKKRQQKISNGT